MRLYIIRHADPEKEKDALTEMGQLQAKAVAKVFQKIGLDAIYSSPLQRAIETMESTAKLLNISPVIENWLKELDWWLEYGSFGRRSAWNLPGEVIRSGCEYLTSDMKMDFENLKRNSDVFLESLGYQRVDKRYRPLRTNNRKIAVFTHGGLGLTWLAHLLELPLGFFWSGFWLDPCSVTTIHFEQRSENWAIPRCLCLDDVSHLDLAHLKPQSSSIFSKFQDNHAYSSDLRSSSS